ncbi:MbnP family protein [Tenacibaculum sp. TC6]|uniref:MbnP family protein n=1 Tax=Tenacibaculum sp. TC6 TaxID=3423223 RepID=UPI003D35BC5F
MKKIIAFIALAMIYTSCSDNELKNDDLEGKNEVVIEFDNGFNNDKLLLGTSTYTNGNGELLTINSFDYIVSNFVLITEEGKEFTYPKEKGYFIISEGGGTKTKKVQISLKDVPAGKYTKIKFGIGVDQERFKQGQAVQQDFWTLAESYNLTWSWQAGYKFVVLEGTYKENAQTTEAPFMLHIASRGTTVDLYKEVTLPMDIAIVSNNQSPQLHIVADANKMLDGKAKIKLSEGATIMGGDKATTIAENYADMFVVHHVHNANHH